MYWIYLRPRGHSTTYIVVTDDEAEYRRKLAQSGKLITLGTREWWVIAALLREHTTHSSRVLAAPSAG